jgi:UDP-glucuronate decarboxylase
MRSLVIGGAGFIGLHLVRRLLADGHAVTILDDFSRGTEDEALTAVARSGATIRSADMTRADEWARLPRDFDEVYLLAAVVGVRNVERDPLRVLRVNTQSVLHLLDWAPPGLPVFFSSTSEVYAGGVMAGMVPVPTSENVPVVIQDVSAPRFAYAVSKLLGEAALLHATHQGLVAGIVGRFHNVYGPRMGTDHVIPEMLVRAAERIDPFVIPGADQSRSFCHVDDAVEAIVRLMHAPDAVGRIVHIGDDTEETNIADLATMVGDIVGVHPHFQRTASPVGSVSRRQPDLQLLRALTAFEPQVPLSEGLARTWEWYQTRAG